ncbi:MAG: hypothetical protein ACREQ3_16715, partial [Candidatus Binatia bacterium]
PEKCTECVGFYDHEACAAVCPVDCCVPNPDIVESEAVLITRAQQLHPEQTFGNDVPSRFRKEGAEAVVPVSVSTPVAEAPQPAAPVAAPKTAPVAVSPAPDALSVSIPEVDDWEVPVNCFRCEGDYTVPFRYFRIGVVFYCPHCTGSMVVTSTIYKNITAALEDFHRRWNKAFADFQDKRRRELEEFEERQRQDLENFPDTLKKIAADANLPGKPHRRLSLFGFQRVG